MPKKKSEDISTEELFSPENMEKVSKIMNDIFEESVQITQEIAKKSKETDTLPMENWIHVGNMYKDFFLKAVANPQQIAEAQITYWQDYLNLWQKSAAELMGIKGEDKISDSSPFTSDKRFKDEAWQKHPYFEFIKNFYLMTTQHIQGFVNNVEGVDEQTAEKIQFYNQNFIDALSPTNFVMTNPEVLRETLRTKGENLLSGLRNFLKDLEQSKEYLEISMTDLKAFEVGKNLAITPGKVVYQNDLIQLIQYAPETPQVHKIPLLIVPPWINKYYILDLSKDNSYVRWIVEQGYTVFMISWVNPDKKYAHIDFEDYLIDGVIAALDAVEKITGEKRINIMGYCIGGTLSGCALAYLAEKKQDKIISATYLNTLLDFSYAGSLSTFLDEDQIHSYERKMYHEGYLDGGSMSVAFRMLRANDLIWSQFIRNYLMGKSPFPFDMLYWNADATNLPAKTHSFYLRGMYLHNLLVKPGGIKLAGVPIDLGKIKVPLYVVAAQFDHIVPWESAYKSMKLHTSPSEVFVLGGSGHVAGVINPPQNKKYDYFINEDLPQDPKEWLKAAQMHPGSWWPHWEKWLRKHSGSKIKARKPGSKDFPALEDAPGSYVKKKLSEVV